MDRAFSLRMLTIAVVLACVLGLLSACSVVSRKESKAPKDIVVWTSQEILHDPLSAKSSEQHFFTSLENKTLFSLSSTGELENTLVKDYLVSKDGTEITITLAENTFSDDIVITSKDVKATLTRVLKAGGDYAKLVESIKGSGEAKGTSDFFGISTPDNETVMISLIAPDPFFVYHLAHPATAILPASTIGIEGDLKFAAHSGDYSANVVSNEIDTVTLYTSDNEKLPTIRVIRKSEEQMEAKPSSTKVGIVLGSTKKSLSFYQESVPQLAMASWNVHVKDSSSPFANIKFRQAVLTALDESESIAPYSTRAVTPTKFTAFTFDSIDCGQACVTERNKASKLVKEIYPDGNVPTITITTENNEIQKALAESASKKLLDIGIPSTINTYAANELSNVIARGEVQLFRFGWVSDVAIGADPLVENYKAASGENVTGLTDASLEEAIATYEQSSSASGKENASKQIQEKIKDLWLTRPVAHFNKIITVNKKLTDVEFDTYGRVQVDKIRLK